MIRYEFSCLPPEPQRLAVGHWLTQHGIEPLDVAVPGWIEVRRTRRQIAYRCYVWADREQLIVDVDDEGRPQYREPVLQLESPPLPFPLDPNDCR